MKKYLLILACALLASLTANAAKAGGECGDDGDEVYWSLSDDGTTLSITGDGWVVDIDKAEESPWYQYRADITTVEIGAGIGWIEGIVFAGCDKLTTFKVDSNNKVFKEQNGFLYGCVSNNIYSIYAYAPGLTGKCVTPDVACDFREQCLVGCNMSSIEISQCPYFNSGAFYGCKNLNDIYIYYSESVCGGSTYDDPFGDTAEHLTLHVPANLVDAYKAKYTKVKVVANEEPSGINDVNANASASKARKFVKDGQIVIEKDGKQYNAAGAEIK